MLMSQVAVHTLKRKQSKKKTSRTTILFDKLVIIMGVANLFATLPQVFVIWTDKNAAGVSSYSWGYYALFSVVFLTYGILHREKPIIASYMGNVVLFSAIFVGSILY